jgi:hypothetical protein
LRNPTDWTFTTVRHWGTRTDGTPWKVVIRDAISKGTTTSTTIDDPVHCPVANPTDPQSQRVAGVAITWHGTTGDLPSNEPPVVLPANPAFNAGTGVVHYPLPASAPGPGPDGTAAYPVLSWDFFYFPDIVPVHPAAPPRSPFEYFPPGSNAAVMPPATALYPLRSSWPATPSWVPLDAASVVPNESTGAMVTLPAWMEFSADGRFVVLRDAANTNAQTNFIHVRLNRASGILDIVPFHPGSYGINVIAGSLIGISRPRRVSITIHPPADDYGEWRAETFTPEEAADESISGPKADPDRDGLNNRIEYVLAGDPKSSSTNRTPSGEFIQTGGATYASLKFTRRISVSDFTVAAEFSSELTTWNLPAVLHSSTDNADGTRTEVWRSADPVNSTARVFGRLLLTPVP